MREILKKKLGRKSVARTGDEKLAKRADAQKEEGKRRSGRPRMQWEDCIKRDLKDWEMNGELLQKIGV